MVNKGIKSKEQKSVDDAVKRQRHRWVQIENSTTSHILYTLEKKEILAEHKNRGSLWIVLEKINFLYKYLSDSK